MKNQHETADIGSGKRDDDDQQAKPSGVAMCEGVDERRTEVHEHEEQHGAGGYVGAWRANLSYPRRRGCRGGMECAHRRTSAFRERPVTIWCMVSGHMGIMSGVRSPSASSSAVEPTPFTIRQLAR
jgi:hypothetical protein